MGFFDRFKKTAEPEKKEEKKTAKKPMAEKKELKTLKLKSETAAPVLPGKEKEAKVKKAKKEDNNVVRPQHLRAMCLPDIHPNQNQNRMKNQRKKQPGKKSRADICIQMITY